MNLERLPVHWIDLSNKSIEGSCAIRDLKLDILVELSGYTDQSRIDMLCHKPAKIQMSYLGYFAPTYLKCIDYWIGDDTLFKNLDPTYRKDHSLVKLTGGYMAFENKDLPAIEELSPTDKFRFGCFNHSRKLSNRCIEVFAKIIHNTKNAELVLKSMSFVEEDERLRVSRLFKDLQVESKKSNHFTMGRG